jgi:hypothetical protein
LGRAQGRWSRIDAARKDRDFDTFPIITRWTIASLLLGIPYVLVRAIL